MTSSNPETLRVVVIDDHEVVRESVAAALNHEPDFMVVGTASAPAEAQELIQAVEPDVAVMDLNLAGANGRRLLAHVVDAMPEVRCVIHTATLQEAEADDLMVAGAAAVVLKSLSGTDLADAIRHKS